MLLKSLRLLTILAAALALSYPFCRLLEVPSKRILDWANYYTEHRIYGPFDMTSVLIETFAFASGIVLLVYVGGRRPAFALTLAGTGSLAAALMLWFILVVPVNVEFAKASAAVPPQNWGTLRDQWEYTQAIRAVLQLIALSLLVMSVIAETPAIVELRTVGRWDRAA